MNREREEEILRITALYVDEVRAGHTARLGDYLAQYPQYADQIADFVAYFHAIEEDVAADEYAVLQSDHEFHIAAEEAIDRIMREQESTNVVWNITSLQKPVSDLQRVAEARSAYQLNEQDNKM